MYNRYSWLDDLEQSYMQGKQMSDNNYSQAYENRQNTYTNAQNNLNEQSAIANQNQKNIDMFNMPQKISNGLNNLNTGLNIGNNISTFGEGTMNVGSKLASSNNPLLQKVGVKTFDAGLNIGNKGQVIQGGLNKFTGTLKNGAVKGVHALGQGATKLGSKVGTNALGKGLTTLGTKLGAVGTQAGSGAAAGAGATAGSGALSAVGGALSAAAAPLAIVAGVAMLAQMLYSAKKEQEQKAMAKAKAIEGVSRDKSTEFNDKQVQVSNQSIQKDLANTNLKNVQALKNNINRTEQNLQQPNYADSFLANQENANRSSYDNLVSAYMQGYTPNSVPIEDLKKQQRQYYLGY